MSGHLKDTVFTVNGPAVDCVVAINGAQHVVEGGIDHFDVQEGCVDTIINRVGTVLTRLQGR